MPLVEHIYDRAARNDDTELFRERGPYLTRYHLLSTPWGGLYLHHFHRGDQDPDPHDHPWDFWTFPLKSYWEHDMCPRTGACTWNLVRRLRWTRRRAEYAHMVLGPEGKKDPREEGVVAVRPNAGFWTLV